MDANFGIRLKEKKYICATVSKVVVSWYCV